MKNQKSTTKDELFLIKLHEMALAKGDVEAEIDRYLIGQAIGQNDKGIDTIVKHLAQANFIKKGEGNVLYLTTNGLGLVDTLLKDFGLSWAKLQIPLRDLRALKVALRVKILVYAALHCVI